MFAVVRSEVVVDELVELVRGADRRLNLRTACDPEPDHGGHEEERKGRAEPPPPGPVRHHRESHRPESGEFAPQRRVRARHRRTSARHQAGQPADQNRVGRHRTNHRQMRRHPLVELDQLVDLRARQPAPTLDQTIEAVPGGAVRQHERVDIHSGECMPGSLRRYGGRGDRRRGRRRGSDRAAAGAGRRRGDRHHRDLFALHRRLDLGTGHAAGARRRAGRRVRDHLHGAGAGGLSGGLRDRDPGPVAGQDGDGPARGFRRRRPGTVPAGAVSGVGRAGGDLGVRRRACGDLQPAVVEGQTDRRRVRRHGGDQRTRARSWSRRR